MSKIQETVASAVKPPRSRVKVEPDIDLDVEYLPGSAVPRYVERLDEVEWVTDRRREPGGLARLAAMIIILIGACLLVIGFASLASGSETDPAPVQHWRPATAEEVRQWEVKQLGDIMDAMREAEGVPDAGVRPEVGR